MKKRRLKKKFKLVLIIIIIVMIFIFYANKNQVLKTKDNDNMGVFKENVSYPNDTYGALKQMMKKDGRIKNILDNYGSYPEELLEMLSRNDEMLDFVLAFNDKKGSYDEGEIQNVKKGKVPLLMQWDKRWGYKTYADSYIAINGCAPTCLSMVIIALTGDGSITPYVVSKYSEENGYYVNGVGTSWDLMTKGAKHFGVNATEISLNKNVIYNALKNGNPIICSMRPGDFTTTGHFIVLSGIKDGKIVVNDPNSKKRSSKLWDYDTLKTQIKNLWMFTIN